jgi:hypothetical protein
MFEVGDVVVHVQDGARGVVLEIGNQTYHVVWEDFFVSWEKEELLKKALE